MVCAGVVVVVVVVLPLSLLSVASCAGTGVVSVNEATRLRRRESRECVEREEWRKISLSSLGRKDTARKEGRRSFVWLRTLNAATATRASAVPVAAATQTNNTALTARRPMPARHFCHTRFVFPAVQYEVYITPTASLSPMANHASLDIFCLTTCYPTIKICSLSSSNFSAAAQLHRPL